MLRVAVILLSLLVAGCSQQPPVRVIHVKNWHFVPKEDFAIDLRSVEAGLTDEAIENRYAAFLDEIESLQREQETLIFGLMRKHGLKQVFYEGVTEDNQQKFKDAVAETQRLQRVIDETDEMARKFAVGSENQREANRLRQEAARLLREGREARLERGCLGRLMLAGQLDDVLPLETAALLDAANPVITDGKIEFDRAAVKAREAEMARRLVASGPIVIVVLGGEHDLQGALQATGRAVTYEPVETPKYTQLAKEGGQE